MSEVLVRCALQQAHYICSFTSDNMQFWSAMALRIIPIYPGPYTSHMFLNF